MGFARHNCTISDCTNKGKISGAGQRNGGIVGSIDVAEVTVSGCVNEGEVSGSGNNAGGIVGFIYTSSTCKITSCINRGSVSSPNHWVGGIVGNIHYGSNDVTIEKCVNESNATVSGQKNVGGIAGGPYADSDNTTAVKVIACANHGTVSSTISSSYTGGIFGYLNNCNETTSCYNDKSGLKLYGQKGGKGTKTLKRCYNITSCSDATTFTSDELKNGALCFNLNGGVTDMYWYQTLTGDNADAYPMLTALDEEANVVNKVGYTKIEYGKDDVASAVYFNTGATSVVQNDDAKLFYVVGDVVATDKAKESLTETTGTNILVKGDDEAYTCANAVLLDATNYAVPYAYTAEKFTYERTLATADAGITTFMLPIATDVNNVNGTVYKLNSLNGATLKFDEVTTGDLEPNTPYLVKCSSTDSGQKLFASSLEGVSVSAMEAGSVVGGNATHIGTYTQKTSAANSSDTDFSGKTLYGYQNGAFVKATSAWTLPAFHTLIAVTGESAAKTLAIDLGGDVTGIGAIGEDADNTPVDVYTLSGVRVRTAVSAAKALDGLSQGVYIVNGKKMVKK